MNQNPNIRPHKPDAEYKSKMAANEQLLKSRGFIMLTLDDYGELQYTYLFQADVNLAERIGMYQYLSDRIKMERPKYSQPELFKKPEDGHGAESDSKDFD